MDVTSIVQEFRSSFISIGNLTPILSSYMTFNYLT